MLVEALLIPLLSYHSVHLGQNEVNWGAGVELRGGYRLVAYHNSWSRTTVAGLKHWRHEASGFGIQVGLGTGYPQPFLGSLTWKPRQLPVEFILAPTRSGDKTGLVVGLTGYWKLSP